MRTHIQYNLGNLIVSATPYDSENELRTRIRHEAHSALVESEQGAPSVFLLLEGRCPGAEKATQCGLLAAQVSIIPQLTAHPAGQLCWLGFDSSVTLLSFTEPKCVATIQLDGLFYDFVPQPGGSVVAVHELGAVCLDGEAKLAWRLVGSDILEHYRLTDDGIVCTYADGTSQSHGLIR